MASAEAHFDFTAAQVDIIDKASSKCIESLKLVKGELERAAVPRTLIYPFVLALLKNGLENAPFEALMGHLKSRGVPSAMQGAGIPVRSMQAAEEQQDSTPPTPTMEDGILEACNMVMDD